MWNQGWILHRNCLGLASFFPPGLKKPHTPQSAMHKISDNMKELGPFLEAVKTAKRSENVKEKATLGKEELKEGKYEKMPISMAHHKKEAKKDNEPSSIIGKIWSFLPQIRKLS